MSIQFLRFSEKDPVFHSVHGESKKTDCGKEIPEDALMGETLRGLGKSPSSSPNICIKCHYPELRENSNE